MSAVPKEDAAEFALTVMLLPAARPSGQVFSLNSPI
jgi:hypothetical protein